MILDKVNFPSDLKTLSFDEMKTLAGEIRELIIKKVDTTGGHMGPNLGIVEATIAMHYVFNTPKDKIIFDVSHQSYPHKILTGRKEGFTNPEMYFKYTGYTAPEESEYDLFKVGHTSTSVSLAVGTAKARDLKCENYNVVALIGDGSLSGGEALEGLDYAASMKSNIIIIVNDNDMSIAENHGGLYSNLKELRENKGKSENNFFKALGFEYFYIDEGNNVEKLIDGFKKVKDTNKPTIVHIKTQKGKGLKQAEENKEYFHWIMPNGIEDFGKNVSMPENYTDLTKEYILNEAKNDPSFVVVNAATPGVFGFDKEFRNKLKSQYVDVGIAEEHAVAMTSALAKNGARPIFAVMSSFVQRTYDQLSQDLALNNSPVTILVYWGGISNADATHLCSFDNSLMSNIPNLNCLAPTNKEEYLAMLDYATKKSTTPTVIRVPSVPLEKTGVEDTTDYSKAKYNIVYEGKDVAIFGLGNFYKLGEEVYFELKNKGLNSTLINPKFASNLDFETLDKIKNNHKVVITLEDGLLDGGFGQKVAGYLAKFGVKVLNYGALKEFTDRVPLDELYKKYRLKKELIIEDIINSMNLVNV